MKKSTILFFLVIVIGSSISAQDLHDRMQNLFLRKHGIIKDEDTYTGSPYDNNKFITGQVITKEKILYKDVPLRFNIYKNSIEFKDTNGEIYRIGNSKKIEYVTIGETTLKYLPYKSIHKTMRAWFKIVKEGDVTLLVKPRAHFNEPEETKPYQERKIGSFNRLPDEIYVQVGNKPAQKVKNKNSLTEIFPEKK